MENICLVLVQRKTGKDSDCRFRLSASYSHFVEQNIRSEQFLVSAVDHRVSLFAKLYSFALISLAH